MLCNEGRRITPRALWQSVYIVYIERFGCLATKPSGERGGLRKRPRPTTVLPFPHDLYRKVVRFKLQIVAHIVSRSPFYASLHCLGPAWLCTVSPSPPRSKAPGRRGTARVDELGQTVSALARCLEPVGSASLLLFGATWFLNSPPTLEKTTKRKPCDNLFCSLESVSCRVLLGWLAAPQSPATRGGA